MIHHMNKRRYSNLWCLQYFFKAGLSVYIISAMQAFEHFTSKLD